MARPRKALDELQVHRHISIPPKYVSVYNELADKHKSAGVAWTKLVDYYLTNEKSALNTYPEAEKLLSTIEDKFSYADEIQLEFDKLRKLLTREGVNNYEAQKAEDVTASDILNTKPIIEIKE